MAPKRNLEHYAGKIMRHPHGVFKGVSIVYPRTKEDGDSYRLLIRSRYDVAYLVTINFINATDFGNNSISDDLFDYFSDSSLLAADESDIGGPTRPKYRIMGSDDKKCRRLEYERLTRR